MLISCKSCRRQYDVEGMKAGEHVRCRCGKLVEVPRKRLHEARVLHCSACGGKLREAARLCEYCGGEITARERNLGPACPECFARLPAGARFCSDCGVEIRPDAIRTSRASARCPRCKGELVLREMPQGHYTECTACAGLWLDDQSFQRVVDQKSVEALGALIPAAGGGKRKDTPLPEENIKYLPCPVCAQLMHRKNFGGSSGVIVDWCKGHGFWFDTHELEKVVEFVNSGGLDRARKLEIERTREELARLERQKRKAGSPLPHLGTPRFKNAAPGGDWVSSLGAVFWTLTKLIR